MTFLEKVNDNFYNIGVPLIMLDKWNDLKALEMKDLILLNKNNVDKNYEQFCSLSFWTQQINNRKRKEV